ncbi:MAG: hypothetical protein SH857_06655 [Chitinophagales bacterium]|nr:hypothetical protein [Chitinophagales bacterium]
MQNPFQKGDKKQFQRIVRQEDCAAFDSGQVHPVYATFALARDAEWTCRLFVLEMKENDEEGIGTFIHVEHHAPALVGEQVNFEAVLDSLNGNEIICTFTAKTQNRIIASGKQGQKILKKEKLEMLFGKLKHG